jgi:hypothetical protein
MMKARAVFIAEHMAGTPEHVAGYLNSSARDDIAWLLSEREDMLERIALLRADVDDLTRILRTYDDRDAT